MEKIPLSATYIALGASIITILSLLSLHILSPEFDPSWRMVSEYANGNYGWVLSLMFVSWAVSSWALVISLWSQIQSRTGKIGLVFLIIAGIGEAMASVFDINTSLHSIAAFLGILSFPIAASLISVSLSRNNQEWLSLKKKLFWQVGLIWASVVLMPLTLFIFFTMYTHAGGAVPTDGKSLPLDTVLSGGVIALVGWANRFLVFMYCVWVAFVAKHLLKLSKQTK